MSRVDRLYTEHPREVPAALTRLDRQVAADVLEQAFVTLLGRSPSNASLALLMSQTALETAHWRSMHCYNFGHIKASRNHIRRPGALHCYYACGETIKGKDVRFKPPHDQTRFRAYKTALEGAMAYVAFLALDTNGDGRNLYGKAWAAIESGDVRLFATEAKKSGYFSAGLERYLADLAPMHKKFTAWLDLRRADEPVQDDQAHSPMTDADLDNALVMLSLMDDDWARNRKERDEEICSD